MTGKKRVNGPMGFLIEDAINSMDFLAKSQLIFQQVIKLD